MSSVTPHLLRGLLARVFSISRRTWIFLAATLVLLIALAIWATISAASWLLGIARDGVNAAPEAVRAASSHVEQVIPGIQEKLAVLLPALTPEAKPREVSGTDPGPVARFPGLARVQWQGDDQETRVRYEGKVDFAGLLEHYVHGFTVQGYPTAVLLDELHRTPFDLLVLGRHGQSVLDEQLLGSVSLNLVHHALCDVLLIP